MYRCGKCDNCLTLEKVRKQMLSIPNPVVHHYHKQYNNKNKMPNELKKPYRGYDDADIQFWNGVVLQNPCLATA